MRRRRICAALAFWRVTPCSRERAAEGRASALPPRALQGSSLSRTHTHRYRLCAPLIVDGAEGVVKTMGIMDEHLLSKEEFDASCTRVCFNDIKVRARIPRYALIPRHASMAQLVLPCLFCTRMPAA